MEGYIQCLSEYKMGSPHEEIVKPLPPGVWKLVLVGHDESTCAANDGPKASWVMEDEQPILKRVQVEDLIGVTLFVRLMDG